MEQQEAGSLEEWQVPNRSLLASVCLKQHSSLTSLNVSPAHDGLSFTLLALLSRTLVIPIGISSRTLHFQWHKSAFQRGKRDFTRERTRNIYFFFSY